MNLNPVRSQPMLGSAVSQRSGLQFKDQTAKHLQTHLIELIREAAEEAQVDVQNSSVIEVFQRAVDKYIKDLNRFSDRNNLKHSLEYSKRERRQIHVFTLKADYDKNAPELIKKEDPLFEEPKVSKEIKLKNKPSPPSNQVVAKKLDYINVEEAHWGNEESNPFLNDKFVPSKKRSKEDARNIKKPTEARLPLSYENTVLFMRQLSKQEYVFKNLNRLQNKLETLQQEDASSQALKQVENAIKHTKEVLRKKLEDVLLFQMPSFNQAHPESEKRHKLLTPPNLLEAFPPRTEEAKAVRKKIEKNRGLKDIRAVSGFNSTGDIIGLTWVKPDGTSQYIEIPDTGKTIDPTSPEIQALFNKQKPKSTPPPNSEEPSPEDMQRLEKWLNPPNSIQVTHGVDEKYEDITTFTYHENGSKKAVTIGSSRRAKGSNGNMTLEQQATRQAKLEEARKKGIRTFTDSIDRWASQSAKKSSGPEIPDLETPSEVLDTLDSLVEEVRNRPKKIILLKSTKDRYGRIVERYLEWQKTDGTVETKPLPDYFEGVKVDTKSPQIQDLFQTTW